MVSSKLNQRSQKKFPIPDKSINGFVLSEQDRKVFHHLFQFVSDHKKQFMDRVLSQRTRHITLVLEDIYQSQNASAAVRTCECLGLQDIHIIEDHTDYSINKKVLKGSNKWIDIHRYH